MPPPALYDNALYEQVNVGTETANGRLYKDVEGDSHPTDLVWKSLGVPVPVGLKIGLVAGDHYEAEHWVRRHDLYALPSYEQEVSESGAFVGGGLGEVGAAGVVLERGTPFRLWFADPYRLTYFY